MKQVKHEIKLSLVSSHTPSQVTGSDEYVLRANVEQAQHRHSVKLDVSGSVKDGLAVMVGSKTVFQMTPDQKVAAGLGGFSAQEVYDAVETFLASVKE